MVWMAIRPLIALNKVLLYHDHRAIIIWMAIRPLIALNKVLLYHIPHSFQLAVSSMCPALSFLCSFLIPLGAMANRV